MFYIFPAVFVFCKVNILLFSNLLNMIIRSVGRWVGGTVSKWSVVGGSVVAGFSKTRHIPAAKEVKITQSIYVHWFWCRDVFVNMMTLYMSFERHILSYKNRNFFWSANSQNEHIRFLQ